MTDKKLKQAIALQNMIETLKKEYEKWNNAKGINTIELVSFSGAYQLVNKSWINFDDLRLLVLARISKRLDEAQKEFEDL